MAITDDNTPCLRVNILGGFSATLNGEPVSHFYSDKVRALLVYLALAGQTPIRRETLAARLWPRYIPHSQRVNLRRAIYELKRNIAPFPLFVTTHQTITLSKEAIEGGISCDARELLERCAHLEGAIESANRSGLETQVLGLIQESKQSICDGLSVMTDGADGFGEWCEEWMSRLHERASLLGSRIQELEETATSGNLPGQITPIIGRVEELNALSARIAPLSHRLLTLTGLGGVGKSRLALAAAHQHQGQFTNGAWWIEIKDSSSLDRADSATLAACIRDGLGLRAERDVRDTKLLGDYLRDKDMMIVLDGLDPYLTDEAISPTSSLLVGLLSASPGLVIVTTSRRNIPVASATPMQLKGLSFPTSGQSFRGSRGLERLLEAYDAPKLFIERSNIGSFQGAQLDDDIQHLLDICLHTEGLPIAIELAASLHQDRSMEEIAQDIRLNPMGLAAQLLDVPQAHRTLRGLLAGSLDGIHQDARLALLALTKLEGTFSTHTAEAHLRPILDDGLEAHRLLGQLAGRSLLTKVGPGKWRMHCLIRSIVQTTGGQTTPNRINLTHEAPRPILGGGGIGIGNEGHYPWLLAADYKMTSRRRKGGAFYQLMG